MKDLFYLNQYFLRYKNKLILGILFIIIANIFRVVSPRVIGNAIDLVVQNISFYNLFNGLDLQTQLYNVFLIGLLIFTAIYLIMNLLSGLFTFFMRQTIIVMSRMIEYDLRNDVYEHYQQLDLAFYKRNNTGDLMSRITEDINRVRMYLGPALMYSINLIVLSIMVIVTMFSINPKLTAYVLIPLPFLSVSIYYVNNLINKGSEEIQRKLSDLTTHAQEVYSGIRVIKAYVQENFIFRFFDKESDIYKDKSLHLAKIEALFFPLMLVLIGLSILLTIYIGGMEVINGRVSPGNIAEFIIYVTMLAWPVTAIGWVASIIQRAAASQKRINEFLHTKTEISNPENQNIEILNGKLEFNNVSFKYPDTGIIALENVSFTINPGERWAIIGRTGAGKSTIAELVVRLYDPSSGEIKIDDQNIRSFDLIKLRKAIGYVPQDVFLFSDTIEQNILFGLNQEDNNLEVSDYANYASINKEIEVLPEKYYTLVGERGVTLSGGQKQRISIARALIKEPKLLILDDCLSAVDANTEQDILTKLNSVLKDRTSIIITHRIFSLLNFDNIIVLQKGRIAEFGKHQELLDQKGIYYELFEKQQLEDKKFT